MRNTWSIFKKEMSLFFTSPIAYMIIAVYLILTGYFFYMGIVSFANYVNYMKTSGNPQAMEQLSKINIADAVLRPLVYNASVVILLIMPLLTMRLYSEEFKTGTIELLLTSPVSHTSIVLGKFFASVGVFALMLALTFTYPAILYVYGNVETGPLFTSYFGLFLIGMAFAAVGNFTSTLSKNQVVSAVLGFGVLLLFWVIGWASYSAEGVLGEFLKSISIMEHFETFAKGVIDSKDMMYYLSFTFVGLFLTSLSLESTKWRL